MATSLLRRLVVVSHERFVVANDGETPTDKVFAELEATVKHR
jgi:hypothetical protein